jgi:hypothetical protein
MRRETKRDLDNVVDSMSGGDGGGRFMALQWMIEEMDKRAVRGDEAAQQIIARLKEFSRLIDVSWRLFTEKK